MFLGHYGLALAAKRATPKSSLGTLTLAANLADCLWPVLLLLGVETVRVVPGLMAACNFDFTSYPWSHSVASEAVLGLVLGLAVFALRHDVRSAVVTGLLVPSHWFLDFLFHRPDLPLWPGGPKLGLGLWNSLPVTLLSEALLFGAGVWLYASATRAKDAVGTIAFWAFVAVLAALYLSAAFGPPPPSPTALAWGTLGIWLFVPWTYWIDRHRTLRPA